MAVVDRNGQVGSRFGTDTYFREPTIALFLDTDGSQCAFIRGHHRTENNFIVAIRGHKLVKKAECWGRYSADCRPLPKGGALITMFYHTQELTGLPKTHKNDEVSEVSRYRNGRLTNLGVIFSPNQNR